MHSSKTNKKKNTQKEKGKSRVRVKFGFVTGGIGVWKLEYCERIQKKRKEKERRGKEKKRMGSS